MYKSVDNLLSSSFCIHSLMVSFSGEWLSPIFSGDCPPPCYHFSLTALTDDTFLMFGGKTADGLTNATYIFHCTKSTIVSITILH